VCVIKLLALLVAASAALAADPKLRIPEGEAKKAAIEKPGPVYPPVARQLKIAGRVVVEAIVSETGNVAEVRVVSGNAALTKTVTDAVKNWRFKPFLAEGKPAGAVVSLSFEFGSR
jgi:periplasmic protein TonB